MTPCNGVEIVRGGSRSTNPDPVLFTPDSASADDEVATVDDQSCGCGPGCMDACCVDASREPRRA